MRRRWLITLLAIPLTLLLTGMIGYRSHTVPPERCSALYREYKDAEGIQASYIQDFRINDTLTVAVTLLEASTPTGWDSLMRFFALSKEMIDLYHTEFNDLNNEHTHSNIYFFIDQDDPKKRPTSDFFSSPCVVASIEKQTFSIYHIHSEEQYMAVQMAEIKNINKNKKQSL